MQGKEITVSDISKLTKTPLITETHQEKDWKFTFVKGGILPSKELDQLVDELKLQGIPDIVYGQNYARLVNEAQNIVYEITPQSSLSYCNLEKVKSKFQTFDKVDKTDDTEIVNVIPPEMKIKQAEYWKDKKVAEGTEIKTLEIISDWTYSTPYKGDVKTAKSAKVEKSDSLPKEMEKLSIDSTIHIEKTDEKIPLHNLTASNPIKWFSEYLLFEDELGDCGLSQSTFRFRTMGDCFFGLLRFYLRIDDVCVRIYDTRIYHEFGKNYILREFSIRENTFQELKDKGFKIDSEFITNHRQSDVIYQSLDLKDTFLDKVVF